MGEILRLLVINSKRREVCTLMNGSKASAFIKKIRKGSVYWYGTSANPLESSLLIGENLNYLEQLERDLRKPSQATVSRQWREYFDAITKESQVSSARRGLPVQHQPGVSSRPIESRTPENRTKDHLVLAQIIHTMRRHGHLLAQVDPLRRSRKVWSSSEEALISLMPSLANKLPNDLNNTFTLPMDYSFTSKPQEMKLGQIYKDLFSIYSGPVGYEFEHIRNKAKRDWLMGKAHERENILGSFSQAFKKEALLKLCQAELFEQYLIKKYPTGKKFGLEGCEALIPGLSVFVKECVKMGASLINIGMSHRGRINVLVNIIEIELDRLFKGIRGSMFDPPHSGDVKYHWGSKKRFKFGKRSYELCLLHNPSHLETACPLVLGKSCADRRHIHETVNDRVWSVIMHGDASMAGQGIIYEMFNLAKLPQFNCSGTLHIAVNNQIGFTADPKDSRSMVSCTDACKIIEAPVLHVNADDIENVLFVFKIATEYRSKFKEDVVINLTGYRRPGHNELDDPRFTQPSLYKIIEKHPTAYTMYKEKALSEKIILKEELEKFEADYIQKLDDAKSAEEKTKENQRAQEWVDEVVDNTVSKGKKFDQNLLEKALTQVEEVLCRRPPNIKNVYPKLDELIEIRSKHFKKGNVDWGMAEATAFLYLFGMRVPVRISGVDVSTGAQRQYVATDQITEEKRNVIYDILESEIPFDIANAPLSHYGNLGFELGYSLCRKDVAVVWDSRYGDILNMAQIIYDQYISSMEEKWGRSSGIVMILPQGYEGEGPDLSSAHPERILSLVPDDLDKMGENKGEHHPGPVIVNVTTPANLFHILVQQYSKNVRKPLLIFTIKLNTIKRGVLSSFADLKREEGFRPYIPDTKLSNPHSSSVTRLLLCSGKIYYDIIQERARKNLTDKIAVARIEQLYPLPRMLIFDDAMSYTNIKNICWVQEEPMNYGYWTYMLPRLSKMFNPMKYYVTYVGREPKSSPAPGPTAIYLEEHQRLLDRAMFMG